MKLQEIRKIAKTRGIRVTGNMKKENIIRAIQRSEGNNDCFGRLNGKNCGQENCLWRRDCLSSL